MPIGALLVGLTVFVGGTLGRTVVVAGGGSGLDLSGTVRVGLLAYRASEPGGDEDRAVVKDRIGVGDVGSVVPFGEGELSA